LSELPSTTDVTKKPKKIPSLISLWIALALWLIVYALQWELGGFVILFFIQPLQWLVLIGCAITSIVWLIRTIVFLVRNGMHRKFIFRIFIGLVLIGANVLSVFYPVDDYYEEARFLVLSKRFDHAAAIALEERPLNGYYKLPVGYRFLSRDDRGVEIFGGGESKVVFFFTFVGILDNFSGYAYAPTPSAYQELLKNGDWVQIIPERENWYFCASM